jgi:hypothetical protein
VAPHLQRKTRALTLVVLAQFNPVVIGQLHQMRSALLQQAAVCGMCNRPGHASKSARGPFP